MSPREYRRRMTARSAARERARKTGRTDRQHLEDHLAQLTHAESDHKLAQRFEVTKREVRRRREVELARHRLRNGSRRLHPGLRIALGLQA